ncbi:hypothetical protein [Microvirga calopogonii]|uniref:hypothetical protein n=1 Tax=Microvirga calopogonii TaxID=2078013 RepID=UPI0013B39DA0|nr:hypothetical protein [Microvirga calopogonii]
MRASLRTTLFPLSMVLCAAVIAAANANQPSLRWNYEVRSDDGQCLARADAENRQVTVFRLGPEGWDQLWTVQDYAPSVAVGGGCLTLILESGDILGEGDPATIVLAFYQRGRRSGSVKLGDVYPDLDTINRTFRGSFWIERMIWETGRVLVRTVDGRQLTFDPASGKRLKQIRF